MDTKVLRTFSQVLDASGELISTVESPPGGFQFSKSFQYVARLGDTKNASVYMARSADGEFAIKVRPMQDVVATIFCLCEAAAFACSQLKPTSVYSLCWHHVTGPGLAVLLFSGICRTAHNPTAPLPTICMHLQLC